MKQLSLFGAGNESIACNGNSIDIADFQQKIWKDGFDSVSLQQLDELIKDIQDGRTAYFDWQGDGQIYNESRSEGNVIASAIICGAGRCSNGVIPSGYSERYEWARHCEKLIEYWAKKKKYWYEDAPMFFINEGQRLLDVDSADGCLS